MRGHAVPREIRRTLPTLLGIYCWTQKEQIQIEMGNGEYGGEERHGPRGDDESQGESWKRTVPAARNSSSCLTPWLYNWEH